MKKSFLHVIFFLLLTFKSFGQFYFLEDANDQIELDFLKHKIETNLNSSFFNVLKIRNPSNKNVTFNANFSYPAFWTFVGEKTQQITLSAGDSLLIPFRISPSIDAKGEIGYSVVASITDLKGNLIKNVYSFVNIPKEQEIKVSPVSRVVYIDQIKKTTKTQIQINNNGNTDELFYIEYILDNSLTTPGEKEGFFMQEVLMDPYSDTIVDLPLLKKENLKDLSKSFYKINVKAYSKDTAFYSTLWAKEFDNQFYNEIPDKYTFLSSEIIFQNLFSDYKTTISGTINGNLLLKNGADIGYRIQALSSSFYDDPWKYGIYNLNYHYKGFDLKLGRITEEMGQDMYGRGANLQWRLYSKHLLKLIATKNLFNNKENFALSYTYKKDFNNIETGGSYVIDDNRFSRIAGGFIRGTYRNKKLGTVQAGLSATLADWYRLNKQDFGLGGQLNYSFSKKRFYYTLNSRFGERYYFGKYNGRLNLNSLARILLNDGKYISVNYTNNINAPVSYSQDSLIDKYLVYTDKLSTHYNWILGKNTISSLGLLSEWKKADNLIYSNNKIQFNTRNALLSGSIRYKNNYTGNYFVIKSRIGYAFVSNTPKVIETDLHKNWFTLYLSSTYQSKYWGLYASYYHGPNSITKEYSYFLNNYYSKNIMLMPYINFYLYPKYIQLIARPNYTYDISAKSSRFNLSGELIGYITNTMKITFSTTYNATSSIDQITDDKYTYSGTYFELRLAKNFNLKQPRYQYHDVEFYFFKDFNGNRIKDEDEPGIKDILLSIQVDETKEADKQDNNAGYFLQTELLSDLNGYIQYKNLPNGWYNFKFYSISDIKGAYTANFDNYEKYIGKNEKIYIPFTENNKIFGKVMLNRSKLSNLGVIDPSNIKVTAEDSYGKKYSSLTDKEGNFTIYVPSVDKYKVRVNNIFFENFELEQNDYEVQLNGYRQFEVNFIFNEKKRKINFTSSYDYGSRIDGPGVEIVRRTNLSGIVKDATTLQPIVATIRVIDGQGNEITSAKSSLKTGIFTMSFIAGDDYTIEVNADDYWFYAEKLYSNQIVTFKNLQKEILIKAITVGSIIPMKTLNFASGSAEIPATSFPELERLLKVLRKNPTVKIAVHGHADDLEIQETTEDLALERAKIVAKYLIANGYNRVKYVGHSNSKPIADNDTEDGRRMNRRVEIVVIGK